MEKEAQGKGSKETESKVPDSSRIIKVNKANSTEKICNVQTDQQKGKSTSKLPRIIRMPSRFYKPIDSVSKTNENSGDIFPGPSKFQFQGGSVKKEDIIPEKLAISHIPRLKAQKEACKETSVSVKRSRVNTHNQFIPECRNIQRVNILINPEFCPEDRTPPASVQSTRPIPSLGQIYGRINMIDSDRLNDWFMELTTPMNSAISSNARTTETSSIPNDFNNSLSSLVPAAAHCHPEDLQKTSTIVMDGKSNATSGFKNVNDNVNVWISTDDSDFPTKDTESGYQTMSPKNVQNSKTSVILQNAQAQAEESMKLNVTYCVGLSNDNCKMPTAPNVDLERSTDTKSLLKEQPTVVIVKQKIEEGTSTSKTYVPHKTSRTTKTDACTNKGTSNGNQTVVTPTSHVPVPSYTDCLSEVLQKTTNFEIIEAIDSTKSPSSSAEGDNEMEDSESNKDDRKELCDKEESTTVDSSFKQQSKTSSDMTFLKSDTTVAHKWSYKSQGEGNSSACQHKTNKRYYDESRHNEMKERCKKCQRFKRFPSSRYKLPRNFGSWRSGISIRRLCCRRWNHVWKKTTERWAIWSTRSPKSRRLRALHLTRSILWEDVDIQTNTLAYTETGTNSVMKEQKSAAITTLFNMGTISKLTETEDNNLKTSEKGQSGFQFPQYQQNESTSFNDNLTSTTYTDAAMSSCNSVKSCQHEDPEDLQNFKADKVTDPISRHRLRRHASNMTVLTQKLIMCNNAETDMRFPCFGTNSKSNMGSGSDITYYRPMASSDITHLVSETKTQQALYPILRKRYSTADSPTPKEEGKRCVSTSIVNIMARVDFGSQIEEKQLKRTEDTATEMTPLEEICVISTGITPSYREIGEKEEVFVSECLLMNSDVEKENLAVQTRSCAPELALGVTKLLSISSKQLTKFISKTVKQTQTDKKFSGLMNKGLRSAVGVDSKLLGSNMTVVSKPTTESIVSKPDEVTNINPSKAVSCGTDAKALFYFSKSTSARGLESYYETEILLNNLIKKALISNCGPPPLSSPFSDKSETSIRSRNTQMNTSTSYTHITLDSKSAGPTASDVCKLVGTLKTDAEIQYVELQEKIAPKSATMMTSFCGLPASIQVPTASASCTTMDKEITMHKFDTNQFTCNLVGFDIETNTHYKTGPLMENLAQTSTVQTKQETVAVNICRNCLHKPKSNLEVPSNVTNPLLSLSRLIGKKRTESTINSASVNKWLSEYSSMETGPHLLKYRNSYKTNSRHALKSLMPPDGQNQLRKPHTFSLKSDIIDSSVVMQCHEDFPALNLSRDSLADVLPVNKTKDVHTRKSDTDLTLNRVMVDRFTSDDYVTKDVKESMLQACPEIRDTGTESAQAHTKKSACVLTTQCVLPTAPSCSINVTTRKRSPDCVFVYGEPRCVVHNDWADAAVQPDLQPDMEVNSRKECLTHSVGQLTSHCSLRDQNQINPSVLIREVLSPKVYKALYETTKLVVCKDAKQMPAKTVTMLPTQMDAGVEAAMADMPTVQSASILTSDPVLLLQSRCHCRRNLNKDAIDCSCAMQQAKKNVECFTVSEETNKESNEECCEDCMKRHLVTSCRYYSNLLTKQLGRVKHNLTKHLAPMESEQPCEPLTTEVCTMKPSGRNASASQTLRHHSPYFHTAEHLSGTLSPATSLTNICKYDKAHLKSVYYMLSAIEGRLRRLKLSAPSTYCQ